jgi:hypothetical protein
VVKRKTGPGPDTRRQKHSVARQTSGGRGARDKAPLQHLIASINAAASSFARQRTPKAARIGAILAEFSAKLDEEMKAPATAVASKLKATTAKKATTVQRGAEPANSPMTADPPKNSGDDIERVRVYTLDRVSGTVAKQIVVREPIDETIDPEDIVFRVGCLELADDEPWTWVDGSAEGDAIRIYFPDDRYYGFPPFLDLERPRKPQVGQTWRLRRTDGATAATYVLRSVDIAERQRPQWKHGDIVRALFEGESFTARFIRVTHTGHAMVHWSVDGTFSKIPMEHVLALSKQRWTRELENEDVEVEF